MDGNLLRGNIKGKGRAGRLQGGILAELPNGILAEGRQGRTDSSRRGAEAEEPI